MKVGIRKPNIKKRIKARTTGKVKRAVKKSVNPLYGKKGMGLINDPKKAMYNKVYNKTTVSVDKLVGENKSHKNSGYNSINNIGAQRKKQNIFIHILLFIFTYGIGNIIYALIVVNYNKKISTKIESKSNYIDYKTNIDKTVNDNNKKLKSIGHYEVINSYEELQVKNISYNTNYLYAFDKEIIEGYEMLREERVVGCYYRQNNINEIIDTFNKYNDIKFKLEIENDFENKYDSNAKKISIIYYIENEFRKMNLGFLSKESSFELRNYDDIKVTLRKIENIDYKETTLAIYLKSEVVQEIKEKIKKQEQERNFKEINSNIAYETNKLAMELEKSGRIEEAKEKYLQATKLGFDGTYPYDRLNVLYRKEKDYEREIENCKRAVSIFEEVYISGRVNAMDKVNKYKERMKRTMELKEKNKNK